MTRRLCHGFTLVEMLVVIAIMALLAAALLPHLGSLREQGLATRCKSNLKQLASGVSNRVADDSNKPDHEKGGGVPFAQSYGIYDSIPELWRERRGWVSWLKSDGTAKDLGFNKREHPSGLRQPTAYAGTGAENGRSAITNGTLWAYVNQDFSTYLCPKHRNVRIGKHAVCRSYAMNGWFYYGLANSFSKGESNTANGSWRAWRARKLYDAGELPKLMLFAEIGYVDPADRTNKDKIAASLKNNGDAVLAPWGNSIPASSNFSSVWGNSSLHRKPNESIAFNHRMQGKNYGFIAYADGHVTQVPEFLDAKQQTNATLRAALGR